MRVLQVWSDKVERRVEIKFGIAPILLKIVGQMVTGVPVDC